MDAEMRAAGSPKELQSGDAGWFGWAAPATAATASEAEAGGGGQDPAETPRQARGDPAAVMSDIQDLKLSHAMTCDMVRSQGEQFNARLDKEFASHTKAIGELRSRLYGGAGEPSVMEDVQMIIDVMRRDLNSQRELLMMVNEQIPALREDLTSLRRGGADSGGRGGGPGAASMSGYVTLQQHEQAFGMLQEEMRALHKSTELAAVKAGFLAVASSECSLEEKAKLFDTLKAKEESIMYDEESMDQGGLETAYRSRLAVGNQQMTMGSNPPQLGSQAGIEFTVQVDKSTGEPLGLQIDHENGTTLLVDAVRGGLIKRWNDMNPQMAVWANDHIVAVNGRRGNASVLLRETEQKQPLTLVLVRDRR